MKIICSTASNKSRFDLTDTEDWLKVRNDIEDVRVRGVIAQELAEVFPEHEGDSPVLFGRQEVHNQ